MADRAVLEAANRTIVGKKVKHLRRTGRIPATVYGHGIKSETIDVDARAFRRIYTSAGDNQLVDLVLEGGRPRPVLIYSTQIDPRRNTAVHVEFYQANLLEKLTARIPIHLIGESPATKLGLMVLSNLDTVEVECLPTDLPQHIEVDISGLEDVGTAIHAGELALDREKCELKTPEDEVVVHVVAPRAAVEEEEEVAEAAEGEDVPAAEAAAAEPEASSEC